MIKMDNLNGMGQKIQDGIWFIDYMAEWLNGSWLIADSHQP